MSPFFNRSRIQYVFIDWFGVLSTNYYWCIQSQKDGILKGWCDLVFDNPLTLNDWMRGKINFEELSKLNTEITKDVLLKSFMLDMKYYAPDKELIKSIDVLFPSAKKVLVSDNMDLFEYVLVNYGDLNSYFDKMYLSHVIGFLKNDRPISLFDFILDDLKLKSFEHCVLIDDNRDNCANFSSKGGRTILIS